MGFSKSTRMMILLGIDCLFFLLEIVVGYAVHSLALVADSFHMLNDVLSLCVGLWAVKVQNQTTNSKMYTYGWQRAETLGALINGVFLVALCLSIFLEAIQRFVEPQEVSHPKLVLIVGCFGLASNIVGLFLFHDHGHAHGGHSHGDHGHTHGHDRVKSAEEGHQGIADTETAAVADERGNVADVLSQTRVAGFASVNRSPPKTRHRSRSRRYSGLEEIPIHPSSFRHQIIESSRMEDIDTESENAEEGAAGQDAPTEQSPLLPSNTPKRTYAQALTSEPQPPRQSHSEHRHARPREGRTQVHGHGHDLNMRGVFLHVMGDALGNIGVIASALIIWLTDYWWRFYSDPLISLIITVIILCSAIPLCKAASRILLQAVPAGLSIDDIKDDINELAGVVSCHHVHVWQLSDSKLVSSLHVQLDFNFEEGSGSAQYMALAKEIRKCLHEYGIHSATIQPEFCLDPNHDHSGTADHSEASSSRSSQHGSVRAGSVRENPDACLLECGDDCATGRQCCPGNQGCSAVARGSD
ncbi:cation efflux protein [Sporormia fimetaria CBS 119925]|uniref:Cation efflux protein n=1 Tax=Sporormia fimetaria CBS 119925 TaxID=1340428 RepID=A0A6A6VMK4_9PLEO|nr:cation efflux protein [Sporormia fimetaria CBS 119925]